MVDELLSRALIAYVGTPGRTDQRSPDQRLADEVAAPSRDLLRNVKQVVADVNGAEPPLHEYERLADMAQAVRDFLHDRYAELSAEAVDAVVERFTYDWR